MQLVKKLGAKQILGDVTKITSEYCPDIGDSIKAYSIFGVANSIKTGVSTYGEWTCFMGNMEATNFVTGEVFKAASCFIPEPLQSMILGALADNDSVEFAFSVHVKRIGEATDDYEYIVEPHVEMKEADPLEHLRNLVPAITSAPVPKLPSPKKEESKKAAPKKAAKKKAAKKKAAKKK